MSNSVLAETARALVTKPKGILAADESSGTIKKRLEKVGIEDTVENHRRYRELLFTTHEIEKYISGVIMFDETIHQISSDGRAFPQVLQEKGIMPGIKVDQGKEPMESSPKEYVTKGMYGLSERLAGYRQMGAKFAKWRALFVIGDGLPTDEAINTNADLLASYALACQQNDVVPVVEPEVLMDGKHTMMDSRNANYRVLKRVFLELSQKGVDLKAMLLKPSWVHPGKENEKPEDKTVAQATIKLFKEVVPPQLGGIVFLSGGDSPEDSTGHLDAIEETGNLDWPISFSFGRALQEPVLEAWKGLDENKDLAQGLFFKRVMLNGLATTGAYEESMEEQK